MVDKCQTTFAPIREVQQVSSLGGADGEARRTVNPFSMSELVQIQSQAPVTAVDRGGLEVWIHMAPYSAVLSGVDRPFSGTS